MHYARWNSAEYIAHTWHLSPMEDLAYRKILQDLYYLHAKPPIGDAASIARQIRLPDQVEAVEKVLAEFFRPTKRGWVNKRAEEEIEDWRQRKEGASKGGKASAEARNRRSTEVQPRFNGADHTSSTTLEPPALPCPISEKGRSERAEVEPSEEGQGGQGQGLAVAEVLGRILIDETEILNRNPGRDVVLLGVGKGAADKGLTEPKLRRLMSLAAGKDRPGGWLRWVIEKDRWDDELTLAEGTA